MKTLPELLATQMKAGYEGPNWLCVGFKDTIEKVNTEKAFWKPSGGVHSIAEIVSHVIAYHQALIKVLSGVEKWELDQEGSFNASLYGTREEMCWMNIKAILEKTQGELFALVSATSLLEKIVPARNYDYLTFITGILTHDTYHLGQIVILAKQYDAFIADDL